MAVVRFRPLLLALVIGAAFGVVGAAAPKPNAPADGEREAKVTIDLPEHAQSVILEVTVGDLPAGATLVLETPNGAYVGSISYFGLNLPPLGGAPQIAVSLGDLPRGPTEVVGRVVQGNSSRPATVSELQAVRLITE